MTKYLVDVSVTTTTTYEVEADTIEEAEQRYPDQGLPIHSEASKPTVDVNYPVDPA